MPNKRLKKASMMFSQSSSRMIAALLLSLIPLVDFKEASAAETPRVFRADREKLDQLEYFQGFWSCKGRQNLPPPFSGAYKFTWKLERTLNDWWFMAQEDPLTKNSVQTEAKTQELWGYDAASKQFIRMIATIEGKFFDLKSSGWQTGNVNEIIWDGSQTDGFGGKWRWRKVMIKKSDREFESTDYVFLDSEGSARWNLESTEFCRKQTVSRPVN